MKENGRVRKKAPQKRTKKKKTQKRKKGGTILGVLDESRKNDLNKRIQKQYSNPMYIQTFGAKEKQSMKMLDMNTHETTSSNDSSFNPHSFADITKLANKNKKTTLKINETYVRDNWDSAWNLKNPTDIAKKIAKKFDDKQKDKTKSKQQKPNSRITKPRKQNSKSKQQKSNSRTTKPRKQESFLQSFWDLF